MSKCRQFALDALWDGTDRIFTLPPQVEPFKLSAIHFRFEPTAAATPRDIFIRIRYGNVAIVWQCITQALGSPTVVMVVSASPDIGDVQYLTTQSAIYDECAMLPLPTMLLDELAIVEFGILGGASGDVADQGSIMIEVV